MERAALITRAESIAKSLDDIDSLDAEAVLALAKAMRPGCAPIFSVMKQVSEIIEKGAATHAMRNGALVELDN